MTEPHHRHQQQQQQQPSSSACLPITPRQTVFYAARALWRTYNDRQTVKSKFPRQQFPRSILVTSSRASPQQVVRAGLVEFGDRHDTRTNGQHYTLEADQSGISAWQAERESRRPTRATSSRVCRRVGRAGEDVTRMLRGNCSRGIPALQNVTPADVGCASSSTTLSVAVTPSLRPDAGFEALRRVCLLVCLSVRSHFSNIVYTLRPNLTTVWCMLPVII